MEIILKGDNAKEIAELVTLIKTPNERLIDTKIDNALNTFMNSRIEGVPIATKVALELFAESQKETPSQEQVLY